MACKMDFPLHETFNLPGLRWVFSLLFFVAYIVLAQISMMLATAPANVTPLYPAAGLAWGSVLLFGARVLPVVFLSAMVANGMPLLQSQPPVEAIVAALGIGAGEVAAVWVGCLLFCRYRDGGGFLLSVKEVVIFSLLSVFWILSPSIGVSTLYLCGVVGSSEFWQVWRTWWLGDSIGILLLLPILLVISNVSLRVSSPLLDRTSLLALPVAAGVALAVCLSELPLWYLLTAVTFFFATRVTHLGIVSINIAISSVCVWANFFDVSSNAHLPPDLRLFLLQLFVAFNTVIGLAFWCSQTKNQELRHKWTQAESKARLDPLTRVFNRRGFEEQAQRLLQESPEARFSLLMLDIDYFKEINDTHGHDVGDRVLVSFTETLQATIRDSDILARVGGEEFVVIVQQDEQDATLLAERLRENIQQSIICVGEQFIKVTASIGVQEFLPGMSIHEWFKSADKRLYLAKHSGRNCVIRELPQSATVRVN